MSPLDVEAPPPGEEIHLPGPTILPLLLSIGLTLGIIGITLGMLIWIPGVILSLVVIIRWIIDTRHDVQELPLEHHH